MGESMQGEHCVLCGAGAAVRVRGTSFCASCGLQHYSAGKPDVVARGRRQRVALVGLFSSGFLAKLLLGAVAVAAVGGVASTAVRTESAVPVDTTAAAVATTPAATPSETAAPAVVDTTSSTTPSSTEAAAAPESVSVPDAIAADPVSRAVAHEYAAAIQAWADCVSTAASIHSGGPFDPRTACPPDEYGLDAPPGHDPDGPGNSEDAPGQSDDGPGNSEDAPGQSDDGPGNSENAPGKQKDRG